MKTNVNGKLNFKLRKSTNKSIHYKLKIVTFSMKNKKNALQFWVGNHSQYVWKKLKEKISAEIKMKWLFAFCCIAK